MKPVTIYDIAKEANVSVATVSRVLNNTAPVRKSTRDRIVEIMNKHQFQPNALARSLLKKETGMLGVLLPDITNPFFPEVLSGLDQAARSKGYTYFLCDTFSSNEDHIDQYTRESQYLSILIEKQVDGIIMIGGRINLNRVSAEMVGEVVEVSKRVPVVMINGHLPGTSIHRVNADERAGAEMAVQHLIDLGHRDIAFIGGYKQMSNTNMRMQSYVRTMTANGIRVDERKIRLGGFNVDQGKSLMEELLGLPERPTAVFCANDMVAIGAIKAARKAGLHIPDDLSIIGFDDVPTASSFIPELTTVSLKSRLLGQTGADVLHGLIMKSKMKKVTVIQPELIVRESTGPVKVASRL
ncbi:LacI family DNA-binding transcriptional regulator [Paenibacillus tarimensis]